MEIGTMTQRIGIWRLGLFLGFVGVVAPREVILGAAGAPTTLIDAVKRSDLTTLRAVLKHADVNEAEPDGTTALHWAVNVDNTAAVELLLAAGALPKVANRYGETPLNLAAVNGNAEIIEH